MAILSHGSDLTLAPTLGDLVRHDGLTVQLGLHQLAAAGFTCVQLDATLPDIRPRELDRRGRRDLAALLNRRSLRLAGIDLFLPQSHYLQSDHQDRAMHATLRAIEMAADLGRVALSIALPFARMDGDLTATLAEAVDRCGIRMAVHAEDQLDGLLKWLRQVDLPAIGAGIDPASLLARGLDPVATAHQLGGFLTVARISDVKAANLPTRCLAGQGQLQLSSYRIAVDLSPRRAGPLVLDLGGLAEPLAAAAQAAHAWEDAAMAL